MTALTGDGVGPELLKYVQEIFRYRIYPNYPNCFSKASGYSFKVHIFTHFYFCLPSQCVCGVRVGGNDLIEERICSSTSKFFPSRVGHFWKGFII